MLRDEMKLSYSLSAMKLVTAGEQVQYLDKVNLVQMEKLNSSADVPQKPTLNGTLNGTS